MRRGRAGGWGRCEGDVIEGGRGKDVTIRRRFRFASTIFNSVHLISHLTLCRLVMRKLLQDILLSTQTRMTYAFANKAEIPPKK